MLATDEVMQTLEKCTAYAPLHTPASVMGIKGCMAVMPNTPQVLVFDTAFHQTMPKEVYMYGLTYDLYEEYGVRRYGAHGTSHRYVSREMINIMGKGAEGTKIITCHIGNGSSISAVKDGKCLDTSMGFTPLAGVEMGTRCGDIDPAIVPYIMEKEGLSTAEINNVMNKKSGFLGVTGFSSDSRDIEDAYIAGPSDPNYEKSKLSIDILKHQIKKYIGGYAAVMNGVDAIVFTAGIGENSPILRELICEDMEYLGVELDKELNKKAFRQSDNVRITKEGSKTAVYVIPTNEELVIARDTAALAAKAK